MYRRPPIDMCLEFCEANGIEPKAHCLNYMTPGEFPKWWKKSDVKHEKELLEKRFRILAERYAERIPMWEVTNETWQPNVFGSFLRRDMSPKPSYNASGARTSSATRRVDVFRSAASAARTKWRQLPTAVPSSASSMLDEKICAR